MTLKDELKAESDNCPRCGSSRYQVIRQVSNPSHYLERCEDCGLDIEHPMRVTFEEAAEFSKEQWDWLGALRRCVKCRRLWIGVVACSEGGLCEAEKNDG